MTATLNPVLSPHAEAVLGALCADHRAGFWLDDLEDRAGLGRKAFEHGVGELIGRGLVAVGRPSKSRGCGWIEPVRWAIREAGL